MAAYAHSHAAVETEDEVTPSAWTEDVASVRTIAGRNAATNFRPSSGPCAFARASNAKASTDPLPLTASSFPSSLRPGRIGPPITLPLPSSSAYGANAARKWRSRSDAHFPGSARLASRARCSGRDCVVRESSAEPSVMFVSDSALSESRRFMSLGFNGSIFPDPLLGRVAGCPLAQSLSAAPADRMLFLSCSFAASFSLSLPVGSLMIENLCANERRKDFWRLPAFLRLLTGAGEWVYSKFMLLW
mmetsp:Transcript_13406/g.25019  ORF Transcript_13406/g.25019 Transcript_13406/m.25019 type:complete len:246 (+) Transcript_13406:658-1395(+)